MIKLSRDNLIVLSRLFPVMLFAVHPFIIFVIIKINFWPLIIAYLFIAAMQFGVGKVWRYFLIQDLYLSKDTKYIIFKSLSDKETEFKISQIAGISTQKGITRLEILNNNKVEKWYFCVNSKDNLNLLDTTQEIDH
jgi:hypothetical protein